MDCFFPPAIQLLGIHLEKTIIPKDLMCQNVHHSTIYTSQDMEAMLMSTSRGMDEEGMEHTHSGKLATKRTETVPCCRDKEEPRDCHRGK